MSHRNYRDKKPTGTIRGGHDDAEILLRAEVAFWREIIGSCDADYPPASLERMQQALALAEYRLMRCYRADGGPVRSTGGPGGTSGPEDGSLH